MIFRLSPLYSRLAQEVTVLPCGFWLSDMANFCALLYENLPEVNWAGFYLIHQDSLWLGPFQGKAACNQIKLGFGVCGQAAVQRRTLVVPDVSLYPLHITCDHQSRSEIVIPLLVGASLVGVLDVDSPRVDRFSPEDVEGLQYLVSILMNARREFRLPPAPGEMLL